MTQSELYVSELCRQSFLPFWSFANPIGKKGKELCDVLVVCGVHVIIISVKDITVSDHKDEVVQYKRWTSKAIHDSVNQIYGAERFLNTVDEVISSDFNTKIKLPPKEIRIVYRIAIAFGSKRDFPLPMGDFGKGFVSVFDEQSTFIVLDELDTITDFTNYLSAKEKFLGDKTILVPSEIDFLGVYLQTNLDFNFEANTFVCDAGVWKSYVKSEDYLWWKNEIKGSFIWDQMIVGVHSNHVGSEIGVERLFQLEEAMRQINLEPRINRIELGNVLRHAIKTKVSGRMLRPMEGSNHTYVFVPLTAKNWEAKESELKLRCIVARLENPETQNIIGIAIGSNSSGESCFDVCYLHIPSLDDKFIRHAKEIQDELGYFKKPVISNSKDFRN